MRFHFFTLKSNTTQNINVPGGVPSAAAGNTAGILIIMRINYNNWSITRLAKFFYKALDRIICAQRKETRIV